MIRAACLIAALLLGGCVSTPAMQREIAWQTLNVVDTGQTVTIARNPGAFYEANPALTTFVGAHPTEKQVYVGMAAYALAHAAVSYWLDEKDPGAGGWHMASVLWGYGTLTEKGLWIRHNVDNGIKPWAGHDIHN